MDPSVPPHLGCFTKTVNLTLQGERLFHIRRNSSFLLLVGFAIIYGLEVYYQNVMAPRGTIYIVGFWSAVFLAVILVSLYRQRRFFVHWVKKSGGITQQTIRITPEGVETEERNGAKWFIPWSLLNTYHIGKEESVVSSQSVMSIAINKKLLTTEEGEHIEAVIGHQIKKPESLPTFKKLFRK